MKRCIFVVAAFFGIVIILFCGTFAVKSYVDNKRNKELLDELMMNFQSFIESSADVEIIETKSVYGKLNGNGNGIQFFGVALLRVNTIKDVETIANRMSKAFEIVDYYEQNDQSIKSKYLEHISLKYETDLIKKESVYYVSLSFFNPQYSSSDNMDIMGH